MDVRFQCSDVFAFANPFSIPPSCFTESQLVRSAELVRRHHCASGEGGTGARHHKVLRSCFFVSHAPTATAALCSFST
jgi:hypothetical protein